MNYSNNRSEVNCRIHPVVEWVIGFCPSHRAFLLLIVCALLLTACERSIDWDIQDTSESHLVVEAILTNELRTQVINLSTSFSELNGEANGVDDADVVVEANGVNYIFEADNNNIGQYSSQESFAIVGGLEYRLSIDWSGKTYNASSKLSSVAPLQDINFTPLFGSDSFYISKGVVPLFSATQQAMYQFDVDWSHIHAQGSNQARMYYYTFNTVHNSQFIRPESDQIEFPSGSIVYIIKFGLNDDFAKFLRAQVIETDWNGSILYGSPENAIGNISNGGLGFFTTCAVLSDTVIVE